jgi:hypothetical protein
MTAVINNQVVIVDGGGRVVGDPIEAAFIDRVSVLIDTLQSGLSDDNRNPVVLGLETIENTSPDSLAFSYLAGYDHSDSTVKVLQRMAIDMRRYAPNVHASIKPVFGRQNGGNISIYATINSNRPNVDETMSGQILPEAIYLRGFTQFDANREFDNYPFSDIGDKANVNRGEFLPQVNKGNVSTADIAGSIITLLPSYPTPGFDFQLNNNLTNFTVGNVPSVMGFNLSGTDINSAGLGVDGIFVDGSYTGGTRPMMENYWVRLYDPLSGGFGDFILMAEQYTGLRGSNGQSRLQLFDFQGDDYATGNLNGSEGPPIVGGENHGWSVAAGNIDGDAANEQLPFFPNNPGDEIIVTQSTKDAAFPSSKLMVLRLNLAGDVPKPSPPNTTLFAFDTVFTQQISGWVAAVNDLDAEPDGKEEILMADNSRIMVLRAKDYNDLGFRRGHRLDTLLIRDFEGETISHASISDMDGDGKNDIIVTTFERTYVIGAPLSSVLSFVSPPPTDVTSICVGDSVDIEWRNIIQSSAALDLGFIETDQAGLPIDTFMLATDIPNPTENVIYPYLIDTLISGKNGNFIIFSPSAPDKISALSGLVNIQSSGSDYTLSQSAETGENGDYYRIGEQILITSPALCIDSLGAEISADGTEWYSAGISPVDPGMTEYTFVGQLPCLPLFDLTDQIMEEEVLIRSISSRGGFRFESLPQTINLRPQYAPVAVDTALDACPSKKITWNYTGFSDASDSLAVLVSAGTGYSQVGTAGVTDGSFVWHVPLDVPESVDIRVSTMDGCIAFDTTLGNARPTFIQAVAPNPFDPYQGMASIVYSVPETAVVTIEIFDQNDRKVAMPVSRAIRNDGIAYCDRWDGITYEGNLAKNGLYYVKLTSDIGITEIYPIFIYK